MCLRLQVRGFAEGLRGTLGLRLEATVEPSAAVQSLQQPPVAAGIAASLVGAPRCPESPAAAQFLQDGEVKKKL